MSDTTPICRRCGAIMIERSAPTALSAWCGRWFDHPPTSLDLVGHDHSVLVQSPELLAFPARQSEAVTRRG